MREKVALELASFFTGMIALCALESFLTRMREHVLFEIATLLAGIVALCTFESFLT